MKISPLLLIVALFCSADAVAQSACQQLGMDACAPAHVDQRPPCDAACVQDRRDTNRRREEAQDAEWEAGRKDRVVAAELVDYETSNLALVGRVEGDERAEQRRENTAPVDVADKDHRQVGRAVCAYAAEHGFDLLVLGRHGDGGTLRSRLGRVAETAARDSQVPVLLLGAP